MVDLLIALSVVGGIFTLENPRDSFMFSSKHFKRLAAAVKLFECDLDQCAYGLRLPGAPPNTFCLKRTKIVGNFEGVMRMTRFCPGRGPCHMHEHAIGSRRVMHKGKLITCSLAKCAGAYPKDLCELWARVIQEELIRRRLVHHSRVLHLCSATSPGSSHVVS